MISTEQTLSNIKSVQQSMSRWWQSEASPRVTELATFSAKNKRTLTGIAATTALLMPPLQVFVVPTMLLATLPAYQSTLNDWRTHRKFGDAAVEASLVTLLVATDHLLLGATGLLLLTVGGVEETATAADSPTVSATAALSVLALPVAGVSGAVATLYAGTARQKMQHSVRKRLQQHNITIHSLAAAQSVLDIEQILLDQSCFVRLKLQDVTVFNHYMHAEALHYASAAVSSQALHHQINERLSQLDAPPIIDSFEPGDVQLMTQHELRVKGQLAPLLTDEHLFVVYKGQLVGALKVAHTLIPQTHEWLQELRQMGVDVTMVSDLTLQHTQEIAAIFGIDEYYADLDKHQKIAYFDKQSAACLIRRDYCDTENNSQLALTLTPGDPVAVELQDESFKIFSDSMMAYAAQTPTRKLLTTTPMVLTIGGVFFLHWGIPAAVAIQGGSLIINYWAERRFKQEIYPQSYTVDQALDPVSQSEMNALAV